MYLNAEERNEKIVEGEYYDSKYREDLEICNTYYDWHEKLSEIESIYTLINYNDLGLFQHEDEILQAPSIEKYKYVDEENHEFNLKNYPNYLFFNEEFNITYKGEKYYIGEQSLTIKNMVDFLIDSEQVDLIDKAIEIVFSVFSKEEFLKSGKTLESLKN